MSEYSSLLSHCEEPSFNGLLKAYLLSVQIRSLYHIIQPQMGGFIAESSIGLSILTSDIKNKVIHIRCSIFYIEQIGGCNCNDSPHEENGYFEATMQLSEQGLLL